MNFIKLVVFLLITIYGLSNVCFTGIKIDEKKDKIYYYYNIVVGLILMVIGGWSAFDTYNGTTGILDD